MKFFSISLFILNLIMSINAYAIDVQPNEVRAPAPGIHTIQYTSMYSEYRDVYRDGYKAKSDVGVNVWQQLIRYGVSFNLNENPALFLIQAPFSNITGKEQYSSLLGDSGLGDISLMIATWPYADRKQDRYFGVAGYLTLPTGSYNHIRQLNVGENRYKAALQAGYYHAITKSLSWIGVFDMVWFGDNEEFGLNKNTLSQKRLNTLDLGLRYDLSPAYYVGAQYFYTFGGEIQINNLTTQDDIRLQRYLLSIYGKYSFGNLGFEFGQDIDTENGFKEDKRVILRYLKRF